MEKVRNRRADNPPQAGRSALGLAATELARSRMTRLEGIFDYDSYNSWKNFSRREEVPCTPLESVRLLNSRGNGIPLYTPHQAANKVLSHERVNNTYMLRSEIRNKGC